MLAFGCRALFPNQQFDCSRFRVLPMGNSSTETVPIFLNHGEIVIFWKLISYRLIRGAFVTLPRRRSPVPGPQPGPPVRLGFPHLAALDSIRSPSPAIHPARRLIRSSSAKSA